MSFKIIFSTIPSSQGYHRHQEITHHNTGEDDKEKVVVVVRIERAIWGGGLSKRFDSFDLTTYIMTRYYKSAQSFSSPIILIPLLP